MKHILKKIFLILFLPCLLISCSCSRGEYVDLPPFNQDYGLVFKDISHNLYYTDYQKDYSVSRVLRSYYADNYSSAFEPRDEYIKNDHLYGIGRLVNGKHRTFVGYCLNLVTKEVDELFRYQESELLEIIKEEFGYEATDIYQIARGYADIDNFDCYFIVNLNETTKIRALEIVIDINTNNTIYFGSYIENQKNYAEEIEKRTGIKIVNDIDTKNPQYTKKEKVYKYDDNFLKNNSDQFGTILQRMNYDGYRLYSRLMSQFDGKLFITFDYFHQIGFFSDGYSPKFVFLIESSTGFATYIRTIDESERSASSSAVLLGAISL